ncbi:VPRE2 protein, partial [Amia calva]|nr:VPRE2 protein [Amia calva]
FLLLLPGLSDGDEVHPWKHVQTSEETHETRIYCNYSLTNNAASKYLYWYQQKAMNNPRYILQLYKASSSANLIRSEEFDGRYTGHLNTSPRITYLSITNTQLSDSAFYYCALSSTIILSKVQLLTKTSEHGKCKRYLH